MGKLIGSGAAANVGERIFIEKAQQYFDDNCIIYWNRQLYGREFDVCVLIPGKGILVIELKGWKEETVVRADNNDAIIISVGSKEEKASPMRQARGYRFSIERHIRQSVDKFPLVLQMVCLPQISKAFYQQKRLDVVCEERFTLLKEDLANNAAFFSKIDQALREANHWNRDPFDRQTMLEVRNLFETGIDLNVEQRQDEDLPAVSYHHHDYSRFYYYSKQDSMSDDQLKEMLDQYFAGCKLYCVVPSCEMITRIVRAFDESLTKHGLIRAGNNIKPSFTIEGSHFPAYSSERRSFSAFHLSIAQIDVDAISDIPDFMIHNGKYSADEKLYLDRIGNASQFNVEQYFAEHADPDKNIVIRAGAGTGKTFTMIARIAFVCYSQNVQITNMADRIVMITFTNEAADQMESKLKSYFQSLYLITSDVEYLHMISYIDHMQISTIHSYAKNLIAQLGTAFGYGIDLSITSSEFYRRKKISEILDSYIKKKVSAYGSEYVAKLGMPVYAIRDSILDFITKLHNKSVDIGAMQAQDFGNLAPDDNHRELHELLAYVIPAVEKAYLDELLESNKIHLSSMMSILYKFLMDPASKDRLIAMQKRKTAQQFMFVDEFQDTDDTQIDALLAIARYLNYKLFLVGDIKQCIYRFRGAREKAFDRLAIDPQAGQWLEFPLKRNYRTDASLLDIFDRSFTAWGNTQNELLTYEGRNDRLIGVKDYNGYLGNRTERYYTCLTIPNDALRIPTLVQEIRRIQRRIQWEAQNRPEKLSPEEKSIAILVRENWQAEYIKKECAKLDCVVQTNTGGDLYMSQPALDMMTLVNALVHFDEAEYLYSLAVSNFFMLDIPKSNLYEMRAKMRKGTWRNKADEQEQVNWLIEKMNKILVDSKCDYRWEKIVSALRTQPVLQAVRDIYSKLQPWNNYSSDETKQHAYQLNVDLLFEQLINACNVDRLTINTLQECLYNSIVSQISVDSRVPSDHRTEIPIQCITVHKSKGLEYGHVILPFCSASLDYIKKAQLHVTTESVGGQSRIGYCMSIDGSSASVQNEFYSEVTEREEKAREETRILYVAMTRAIRSFSWIALEGKQNLSWQNLIDKEA